MYGVFLVRGQRTCRRLWEPETSPGKGIISIVVAGLKPMAQRILTAGLMSVN